MREARWRALLRKSTAACVAAIEIYNKPASPHREETFATLAVCAWEGLLKARLVREANTTVSAIYVVERLKTKAGEPSRRSKVKLNRCGNPMTIGVEEAIRRVRSLPSKPLDILCEENLRSLIEIRDNAVHFINDDRDLARRTHEAGCACLQNYVTAVGEWFGESLGDYRFAILPLSFEAFGSATAMRSPKRSQQAERLAAYLDQAAKAHQETASRYAVSLRVEVSIVGNRASAATPVRLTSDPDAAPMVLQEADIAKQFPLTYRNLLRRLQKRVPGFKANQVFNAAMKKLKSDPRLAHERRLNPRNPKSSKTWFYSDAMVDAVAREIAAPMPQGTPAQPRLADVG